MTTSNKQKATTRIGCYDIEVTLTMNDVHIDWSIQHKITGRLTISGSAKWDGCYDFRCKIGHVCEMGDFTDALVWVEARRLEMIDGAK